MQPYLLLLAISVVGLALPSSQAEGHISTLDARDRPPSHEPRPLLCAEPQFNNNEDEQDFLAEPNRPRPDGDPSSRTPATHQPRVYHRQNIKRGEVHDRAQVAAGFLFTRVTAVHVRPQITSLEDGNPDPGNLFLYSNPASGQLALSPFTTSPNLWPTMLAKELLLGWEEFQRRGKIHTIITHYRASISDRYEPPEYKHLFETLVQADKARIEDGGIYVEIRPNTPEWHTIMDTVFGKAFVDAAEMAPDEFWSGSQETPPSLQRIWLWSKKTKAPFTLDATIYRFTPAFPGPPTDEEYRQAGLPVPAKPKPRPKGWRQRIRDKLRKWIARSKSGSR